jgi:hypothetical protein
VRSIRFKLIIAISFSFQEKIITKGLMAIYENVSHVKRFHPSLMLVMRVLVVFFLVI